MPFTFPKKRKIRRKEKHGTKFIFLIDFFVSGEGERRKSLDFFCFLNVVKLATSI
jgi:hypothetical protein